MRRPSLPHTKSVWANGSEYLYFVTNRLNAKGKPIRIRLPARSDPSFGAIYGAHLAGLSRRAVEVLIVPDMVREFMRSDKFKGLSTTTQRVYAIYLDRFADQMPTAPANEIERKDVLQVASKMKPAAANMFVKAVTALYRWGRYWEKVTVDPCKEIEVNEGGEHEPWSEEALNAGLSADDDMVRLAVYLLYYGGQRIGDTCRMAHPHIVQGRIQVTQEKTGKYLEIPIHENLAAEIAKLPRSLGTLLSFRNRPVTPALLRTRIKAYMGAKGHNVVPHGLRKNAVNTLLEMGCTVAETSAITGQSLAMVERYARKRNQVALGSAAILKWERGQIGNGQK